MPMSYGQIHRFIKSNIKNHNENMYYSINIKIRSFVTITQFWQFLLLDHNNKKNEK